MSKTVFEKIDTHKYAVHITLLSGKTFRILVKKVQVGNPSARGGAYKFEWVAYNGGLYVRETDDTRQGAYNKAIAALKARNLVG